MADPQGRRRISIETINSMRIDDVPIDIAYKHAGWLRMKYVNCELSAQDIADITACTRKNIEYWLRKYNIPRRDNMTRYTERYLRKISETGKGRIPFSKGLTKEDHPSLMLISKKMSGENSPSWKGGIHIDSAGYRRILAKEHPYCDKDGYVLEHRLVMEDMINRLLLPGEVVHHRDQNRQNNAPKNLFLFPDKRTHMLFHMHKNFKDSNITEEEFMSEVIKVVT
jgi:hypothetical protein